LYPDIDKKLEEMTRAVSFLGTNNGSFASWKEVSAAAPLVFT